MSESQKRERPSLSSTGAGAAGQPEKRSYSGKFDIYQDNKDTKPLNAAKGLPEHQSSSYIKTSTVTREVVNKMSNYHSNHLGEGRDVPLKGTGGSGVHRYDQGVNAKIPSSSGTLVI